jgi:hypothetical protein
MNRKILTKVLAWLVALLLAAEALYCFAVAASITSLFRGAQNVRPSDPLPALVWWYVAGGLLWLIAAIVYLLDLARVRRWFVLLAVPALIYGGQGYQRSTLMMLSWTGVFHGDLVALGAASTVVFCLMGVLGILYLVIDRSLR